MMLRAWRSSQRARGSRRRGAPRPGASGGRPACAARRSPPWPD